MILTNQSSKKTNPEKELMIIIGIHISNNDDIF